MPLSDKERLRLDKVFMAFGSLMKAVDRSLVDEGKMKQYAEAAWTWSILKVSALVDDLWEKSEKAGPESPPPPQQPLRETETITVKGVTLQSTGNTKQGRQWKLYKVTDTHDNNYFTFHTSFQIGETYDVDWEWQEKDDRKWRSIKETPRPVKAAATSNVAIDDDEDSIPF
jgi:hypothetical protein